MPLRPGDRIPNFQMPASDGLARVFYFEVRGGPVLMFAARPSAGGIDAVLAELAAEAPALAEMSVETFVVLGGSVQGIDPMPAHVAFEDQDGKLLDYLLATEEGPSREAAFLIIDSNQRLLASVASTEVDSGVQRAVDALRAHVARPMAPPTTLQFGAPVLLMDNLLEPAIRQQLIESWKNDHREGLVNDGRANMPDAAVKRNREHEVVDAGLKRLVANTIGPRIKPELEKAFNYFNQLRFEAFTVLSYTDEREDFFAPHRDNIRANQKRRFAMSLNLNDDFEGGDLWFPEYGPHRYRPAAGAGVIFSCDLLHEALPVTRGQRWVLVTFMCE